jgi:membrane-bound lytic murein transglycosylase B
MTYESIDLDQAARVSVPSQLLTAIWDLETETGDGMETISAVLEALVSVLAYRDGLGHADIKAGITYVLDSILDEVTAAPTPAWS